jgi:hypothetical protein
VNPAKTGTKASAHYQVTVSPQQPAVIRLRLTDTAPDSLARAYRASKGNPLGSEFDGVVETRRREADEFYSSITPPSAGEDEARVMRQALAGMLWTKQYYLFDVNRWLEERGLGPMVPHGSSSIRNQDWYPWSTTT